MKMSFIHNILILCTSVTRDFRNILRKFNSKHKAKVINFLTTSFALLVLFVIRGITSNETTLNSNSCKLNNIELYNFEWNI